MKKVWMLLLLYCVMLLLGACVVLPRVGGLPDAGVTQTQQTESPAAEPAVSAERADEQLLAGGNYHDFPADTSQYAYAVAFYTQTTVTDVALFQVYALYDQARGPDLFTLDSWGPEKPIVAMMSFPGVASSYGLTFTDSRGTVYTYGISESGKDGSVCFYPIENFSPESILDPRIPERLELLFASGVGAWGTTVTLCEDGSFRGSFSDSEMGSVGEGYPNGSRYVCDFSGKFTVMGQDPYSLYLHLETMELQIPAGTEWIEDGIRHLATTPYGLDGGTEFVLYMPNTPVDMLSEEALSWYHGRPESEALGCYALVCPEAGTAFYGN